MADSDAEHTFFFADLAGFTALTEAMGDESAAGLAGEFCGAVTTRPQITTPRRSSGSAMPC